MTQINKRILCLGALIGLLATPSHAAKTNWIKFEFEGNATNTGTMTGVNGAASGSVSYGAGKNGNAVYISPVSQINFDDNVFRGANGYFELSLWFKTSASGGIFGIQDATTSQQPGRFIPVLSVRQDGKLAAELWTSSNKSWTAISTNAVNDDTWHEVKLRSGNNKIEFFLDNQIVDTATAKTSVLNMWVNQIGANRSDGRDSQPNGLNSFTGWIDDFSFSLLTPEAQTFDSLNLKHAFVGEGAIQLPKTTKQGQSIVYTSYKTSVCQIQDSNKLNLISKGTCLLDAQQVGSVEYTAASTSYSFAVKEIPVAKDSLVATEEQPFTLALKDTNLASANWSLKNGSSLPNWLKFSKSDSTFLEYCSTDFIPQTKRISGMWFDERDQKMFVATTNRSNSDTSKALVYSVNTKCESKTFATIPAPFAMGVLAAVRDTLYMATSTGVYGFKLADTTLNSNDVKPVVSLANPGKFFTYGNCGVITKNNFLYTCLSSKSIAKIDLSNKKMVEIPITSFTLGLGFDAEGSLLYSDLFTNKLMKSKDEINFTETPITGIDLASAFVQPDSTLILSMHVSGYSKAKGIRVYNKDLSSFQSLADSVQTQGATWLTQSGTYFYADTTGKLYIRKLTNSLGGTPSNDDVGNFNFTLIANGSGVNSDHDINLQVNDVNDAPTSADKAFSITRNKQITQSLETKDFAFADIDKTGDAMTKILVKSPPKNGSLSLDDKAVSSNQEIDVNDIVKLKYSVARGKGSAYADTIPFQVKDDEVYSDKTYHLTFDVTRQNHLPIANPGIPSQELDLVEVRSFKLSELFVDEDLQGGLSPVNGEDAIKFRIIQNASNAVIADDTLKLQGQRSPKKETLILGVADDLGETEYSIEVESGFFKTKPSQNYLGRTWILQDGSLFAETARGQLQVLDANGKILFDTWVERGTHEFKLGLSNGTYYIRVGCASRKVVKEDWSK